MTFAPKAPAKKKKPKRARKKPKRRKGTKAMGGHSESSAVTKEEPKVGKTVAENRSRRLPSAANSERVIPKNTRDKRLCESRGAALWRKI